MFSADLPTAVHRSFAVADNLGEVSARAQIQTVCFDSLGLMLAAALNILLQASLPFVVYPIFSAIDLIGIYQGLKHVHQQTLTEACHIHKAILSSVCKWESILEAPDNSDSVSRHWFQLIEDSKRIARRDFNLLNEQMLGLSWACKNILLSTQEQARYSFVDD
ncbi:hypothetical protein HYC85_028268 [Camellia sinensis]|uniref:Protein root UVB sensitive/RUS domain-containing protein n=1 Tax=Camellia sinensis TaxID=4442 RepID=A0A7J7FVF7_CAMSI|nr:hypothetical protein HYC85_028268 [Camellia sinensis]